MSVTLAIKIIMLVVSIILVIAVSLQESKSDGLSGVIGGGAEQLFGKKKSKGYDAILHRITFVGVVIYFGVAIISLIVK